jgi:hypothetical protein
VVPYNPWRVFLSSALLFLLLFLTIVDLYLPFSLFKKDRPDRLFVSPYYKIKPDPSIPISRTPDTTYLLALLADIIDRDGQTVHLKAINWYGASDIEFIPYGLDHQHRDSISAPIKRIGFNTVRLPYSDEMVIKSLSSRQKS